MDHDPTRTTAREARRRKQLGPGAACALCGLKEPTVLKLVTDPELAETVRQILLERHHVLGRALDPGLTIVLCRNCHALAREYQLRNAVPTQPQDNFLDRLCAALRSLAAFLEQALAAVERWLEDLEEFISFLDAQLPNWRELWRTRK